MLRKGDLVIYRLRSPDDSCMGIVVEDENIITKRAKVRWLWGDMSVSDARVEWIELVSRVNHA